MPPQKKGEKCPLNNGWDTKWWETSLYSLFSKIPVLNGRWRWQSASLSSHKPMQRLLKRSLLVLGLALWVHDWVPFWILWNRPFLNSHFQNWHASQGSASPLPAAKTTKNKYINNLRQQWSDKLQFSVQSIEKMPTLISKSFCRCRMSSWKLLRLLFFISCCSFEILCFSWSCRSCLWKIRDQLISQDDYIFPWGYCDLTDS